MVIPERIIRGLRPVQYQAEGELIWLVANFIYKIERFSRESQQNLAALRKHLRDGSAVLYFNHVFLEDGPFAVLISLKKLGFSLRAIGGPQSQAHFDEERFPEHARLMRLGSYLGLSFYPVIQHYDKKSYDEKENWRLLKQFLAGSREILSQPGGVILIAPEGTRSQNGCLQPAQTGIEHLRKRKGGPDVYFVPLAIIPKSKFSRERNQGVKVEFRVGQLLRPEEVNIPEGIIETQIGEVRPLGLADGLLIKVAELLPEGMRGAYAPFVEEQITLL